MILAALNGCATIRTDSYQDPSADFNQLTTYAWVADKPGTAKDLRMDAAFLDPLITGAVDDGLNEKGYTRHVAENASFWLDYAVNLEPREEKIAADSFGEPEPAGGFLRKSWNQWEWTPSEEARVRHFEEGALFLSAIQPSSGGILWQGSAQLEVDRSQGEDHKQAAIRKVVRALLRNFPSAAP